MWKRIKTFYGRITEYLTTGGNELSRQVRISMSRLSNSWWKRPSHDWSRPDYAFWRRAYYCRARGLELSGLFIKPLVNKTAAWVMGRPPQWKLDNENAATALGDWWADNHADILRGFRASLRQGDGFIVVNPDLTLTIIPPDNVEPLVSDDDYSQIIGWRITQTYQHPQESTKKMTLTDEYFANGRIQRWEIDGRVVQTNTYANPTGRIPVIHIANSRDDGETFGHPEAEALVEVFQRYGVVLEAGIEGNELQGRPTPVIAFETKGDLDAFWDQYGVTETQTLPDGSTESVTTIGVDLKQLLTVSGATFDYKSPGSFIGDMVRLLEIMFYLILEHTELPEFVFGNAISSSKASAETQMPIFAKFIEMKRGDAEKWIVELAETVMAFLSFVTPGIGAQSPKPQWEQLTQDDGQLTLSSVQWAYGEGLIDEKTALMLIPVDIEDVDAVLEAARAERAERFPENREQSGTAVSTALEDEINQLELEV